MPPGSAATEPDALSAGAVCRAWPPPVEQGPAGAGSPLSDTLGTTVGTGIGGAVIAVADAQNWTVLSSTSVVSAMALTIASCGVLASRRLPLTVAG